MRVLPAHAPQDRAGRLVSRHQAARTRAAGGRSPRSNAPVGQGRRSKPAHANPWRDRPAAKGPLKGAIDGISARPQRRPRRLLGRYGRQPLLCWLVNPGLPGKPFVAGFADRTESAREKYRTASKPFPVSFHACRDRASCLGAFDHDDAHLAAPWISYRQVCSPSAGMRPSRGGTCSSRSWRGYNGSNED